MPRQHGTLEEAIAHGCIVTEYHEHEANPRYTVHVRSADGVNLISIMNIKTEFAYTNITKEHLENVLPKTGLADQTLVKAWKNESTGSVHAENISKKTHSFAECVQKKGKIVDFHPTVKGTYAV